MYRSFWTYLLACVIGVFGASLTACDQGGDDTGNGDGDTEQNEDAAGEGDGEGEGA